MYVFADKLYKKGEDEISLEVGKKQIVFTTTKNKNILDWLLENGFHESFIEDIKSEDQSVAYEENEGFKLIILKFFKPSKEDELLFEDTNIVLIITKEKLIFLSEYEDVTKKMVGRFYRRYKATDSIEYLTYIIMDILIDNTMGIVDFIDDKLEEIEDNIFDKEVDEDEIQKRLYFARRSLNRIAKQSVLENDIINKIYNHYPTAIRKKLKFEFIDLKEHLSFLINESKSYLERTGYLQNLLMGFLSNRMNQAMQRLAAISLIFLPLTFIVGNYGMNFKYMPELNWKYGYFYIWGINLIIGFLIYRWLKRKKWI
ncbi:magnesium transporter CorA family protein [Nitrosophilus kaiyonis]|uniref:magnesium transporter CorA family protein n=1 Tax=Nitrosophilus kaiyonis TaxID=2930200 RepID=UPI0024918C91|nr:magnesium transporter CorA family protein [Nitrosophilus kaiyonis]